MNKQTEQMIDFIDQHVKAEVMQCLKDTQWQAIFNGASKVRHFMYGKLTDDTRNNYTIIHDFMTHCMGLVDWEKVAAYYLEQKVA